MAERVHRAALSLEAERDAGVNPGLSAAVADLGAEVQCDAEVVTGVIEAVHGLVRDAQAMVGPGLSDLVRSEPGRVEGSALGRGQVMPAALPVEERGKAPG